jgi:hypothetical protein
MSAAQLRDYYVPLLAEETIARTAIEWRRAAGIALKPDFNIVTFFEAVLVKHLKRAKGTLKVDFFDMESGSDPAYVTIDDPSKRSIDRQITLHVDKETWSMARIGEPAARVIVAHEIGHIVLHAHYERAAFSRGSEVRLKAHVQERSAEWQADTFMGYLLLPACMVRAYNSPREIAAGCSVPSDLAEDRFGTVRRQVIYRQKCPDRCPKCGDIDCQGFC